MTIMTINSEQDNLEKRVNKPNYPQPHNIKPPRAFYDNPALEHHYRHKEHHRLKYNARWLKSKQSKRGYDGRR